MIEYNVFSSTYSDAYKVVSNYIKNYISFLKINNQKLYKAFSNISNKHLPYLIFISYKTLFCSKCNWSNCCRGCIVENTNEIIGSFGLGIALGLYWPFNPPEFAAERKEEVQNMTLYDCFDVYSIILCRNS